MVDHHRGGFRFRRYVINALYMHRIFYGMGSGSHLSNLLETQYRPLFLEYDIACVLTMYDKLIDAGQVSLIPARDAYVRQLSQERKGDA